MILAIVFTWMSVTTGILTYREIQYQGASWRSSGVMPIWIHVSFLFATAALAVDKWLEVLK